MKKLQQLYRRAARHVDLDFDATEVIKEGWMWKQGEVKKTWKKRLPLCPTSRWCVLTPKQLTYYKSNDYSHALGSVPIVDCLMVEVGSDKTVSSLPSQDVKVSWSFLVQGAQRTFYFVAASELDKHEWMQEIGHLIICLTVDEADAYKLG
ncbi:hypothetical protein GUITHDRAFT_108735 [Guillardia theta CCMP2712]|uniref:PH domain-containing protein n=1 Tax=Guillardia theta (strain CCMP2712) TaxID=905079 RepID=L1JAC1_GUITC|nr:hypothetical protein GUITHDRAFT_108735 [Guillardia theta CCMP2712]EKX45471.1 hypothetical protein GUITHDRAFT_108735 [Guillardia theta CCMP2712]|eukprot:XP_005832451.1 hypothetical protein GUITHDRAFT_108735 [Guillardia theta CCMP2712]